MSSCNPNNTRIGARATSMSILHTTLQVYLTFCTQSTEDVQYPLGLQSRRGPGRGGTTSPLHAPSLPPPREAPARVGARHVLSPASLGRRAWSRRLDLPLQSPAHALGLRIRFSRSICPRDRAAMSSAAAPNPELCPICQRFLLRRTSTPCQAGSQSLRPRAGCGARPARAPRRC